MSDPASSLPLSRLRVLAVEQYGAGPFGTSYLADLGAEVVKIENHRDGGDVGRHVGPHFFGADDSHFFQTFNRNKKSITLDLKHPDGMAVFKRLVGGADAVLDNLRGDLPTKLGLDYAALEGRQPAHRLRPPVRLRPQRLAPRLARLRLPDAGRGRPHDA